jgi:hypothetical protein
VAHESNPRMCVMLRLIQWTMCSKFAASRQHEKFPTDQTFDAKIVPGPEQKFM